MSRKNREKRPTRRERRRAEARKQGWLLFCIFLVPGMVLFLSGLFVGTDRLVYRSNAVPPSAYHPVTGGHITRTFPDLFPCNFFWESAGSGVVTKTTRIVQRQGRGGTRLSTSYRYDFRWTKPGDSAPQTREGFCYLFEDEPRFQPGTPVDIQIWAGRETFTKIVGAKISNVNLFFVCLWTIFFLGLNGFMGTEIWKSWRKT